MCLLTKPHDNLLHATCKPSVLPSWTDLAALDPSTPVLPAMVTPSSATTCGWCSWCSRSASCTNAATELGVLRAQRRCMRAAGARECRRLQHPKRPALP